MTWTAAGTATAIRAGKDKTYTDTARQEVAATINYDNLLAELEEEKAACQYAYGGMVPAFYTQALRKAIEDIKECRDSAEEAERMAKEANERDPS